jgi:trans-aconitate 2-methyltransferase
MPWDPDQYLAYADERALPFHHLVAAVVQSRPKRVLDIGCGPGALTATLLLQWPDAEIHGIDSSPEMIDRALRRGLSRRLSFELADITEWAADQPFDLVLSNACFHWIEDHAGLLDRLVAMMTDDATLAFQVPANHDRPSHTHLGELCASTKWRHALGDVYRVNVNEPDWYANELETRETTVTAWQTTYLHRLEGEDPVLEWAKGTALRPILERLEGEQVDEFLEEYGARLRESYPARDGITIFPFTRTFVVATRSRGHHLQW